MAMLDFDFIIHIFEVERPWPREYNRRHPNYDNFRVLIYRASCKIGIGRWIYF
jgi:hypothetical protein